METKAKFRWIDARKGVLEVTENGESKTLYFGTQKIKLKLGYSFFKSLSVTELVLEDGIFYYNQEGSNWRIVCVETDAALTEHYQQWLSRVMLAEDIHKSRAEERKGLDEAFHGSNEQSSSGSRKVAGIPIDDSSGNDGNGGRVPLRKDGRNFAVVPSEHAWKIRPR